MTDLKKLSEKMAEEFGQKCADDGSISPHQSFYDGKNGFLSGFQSCLDLLAKQSCEQTVWQIYPCSNYDNENDVSQEPLVKEAVDVVPHAALLSANAKIAKLEEATRKQGEIIDSFNDKSQEVLQLQQKVVKLEEELTKKHVTIRNDTRQENTELQQRVKELEDKLKKAHG